MNCSQLPVTISRPFAVAMAGLQVLFPSRGNPFGQGITVSWIEITGYASPEGPLELNKCLSEDRARALQEYLQNHLDFPRSYYNVSSGGENWRGLEDMIRESDMKYRQETLDIIARYTIEKGREGAHVLRSP
jgi:hypothetical protein